MHSDSRSFVRGENCRALAVRAPRLASTSFTRRFSRITQYSISPPDSPLTRCLSIYVVSFADRWEREMSGPQTMHNDRHAHGPAIEGSADGQRATWVTRRDARSRIRGTPTEAVAIDFVTRAWAVDIASDRPIPGLYGFLPPREPLLYLYGWLHVLSTLYGWL